MGRVFRQGHESLAPGLRSFLASSTPLQLAPLQGSGDKPNTQGKPWAKISRPFGPGLSGALPSGYFPKSLDVDGAGFPAQRAMNRCVSLSRFCQEEVPPGNG